MKRDGANEWSPRLVNWIGLAAGLSLIGYPVVCLSLMAIADKFEGVWARMAVGILSLASYAITRLIAPIKSA